jgi:hypothetical protein
LLEPEQQLAELEFEDLIGQVNDRKLRRMPRGLCARSVLEAERGSAV